MHFTSSSPATPLGVRNIRYTVYLGMDEDYNEGSSSSLAFPNHSKTTIPINNFSFCFLAKPLKKKK